MRMLVPHGFMPVPMCIWLGEWSNVVVLMMFVVTVDVIMLQRLMRMLMVEATWPWPSALFNSAKRAGRQGPQDVPARGFPGPFA